MSMVIVNDSLRTQLPDLSRGVEFRDEAGKTLGWFLPTELYKQLILRCVGLDKTEQVCHHPKPPERTIADVYSEDCLEIIMDGPEDNTVRPPRPEYVKDVLARRERHARLMELWKQQQEQEKAKEASANGN